MRAKFNYFERALQRVSPSMALKRFRNRVTLEQSVRAYEAIEQSRLRKKREDGRSADQINLLSIDKLRMQARYLDENHDNAKSVLNTLVSHVVGSGIQTFPMVKTNTGELADKTNDAIQMLWERWGKRPEVTWEYGWSKVQTLAARSWFRDGEMFMQHLMGNVPTLTHGTPVAFSVEMFEADYCPTGLHDEEQNIRQGVEKDSWGKPLKYWFWKEYPTEFFSPFNSATVSSISHFGKADPTKFDVFDANKMVHLKFVERIRQTRGVSIFASVYQRLDDLKDYEESERVAARIGAAFALAITKTIDSGPGVSSEASWREMDIAPGIIADQLQPGEKIENITPERPSNLLAEFRTTQLRSVAGGTNTGFSSISKQYEGTYSSQRQELMEQNNIYHTIRREYVNAFIDPTYFNFVRTAVLQNLVPLEGVDLNTIFDAEHVGSGVPYIEPKREMEADEKRVQSGFASRAQIILQRGGNPQVVRRQIEQERAQDEKDSLDFSSTSGANSNGAGAQPASVVGGVEEPADDDSADRMKAGNIYEIDGVVYECLRNGSGLALYEKAKTA